MIHWVIRFGDMPPLGSALQLPHDRFHTLPQSSCPSEMGQTLNLRNDFWSKLLHRATPASDSGTIWMLSVTEAHLCHLCMGHGSNRMSAPADNSSSHIWSNTLFVMKPGSSFFLKILVAGENCESP